MRIKCQGLINYLKNKYDKKTKTSLFFIFNQIFQTLKSTDYFYTRCPILYWIV